MGHTISKVSDSSIESPSWIQSSVLRKPLLLYISQTIFFKVKVM